MKRMLMLALTILGLTLLLGANSAAAADAGDIRGTVTLSSGAPAANTTVQLNSGTTVMNTTTTDSDGNFSFSGIAPGNYTITSVYNGHKATANVTVITNRTAIANMIIQYAPTPDDDVDDDTDDDVDDDVDDDIDDDNADDDSSDAGLSAIPLLIFGFILLFIVALVIIGIVIAYNYSKITHDRLMEHETRMKIFEHIQKDPGQHLRKIGADLDLPMGVLTHHIGKLEKEEVIKFQLDGKFKRYYPWDSKIEHKPWLSDIQNDIMAKVRSQPGISANDLVEAIGGSRSNTYYHIQELEGKGILRVDRQEKKHRCYPIQET